MAVPMWVWVVGGVVAGLWLCREIYRLYYFEYLRKKTLEAHNRCQPRERFKNASN